MTSIGMNLTGVSYWSTEFPFIDRIKMAGNWSVIGGTEPIALDEHGFPRGVPAGASSIYVMVPIDPPSAGTSKNYVLTYEGTATFSLPYATILSSEPGRIVFRTDNPTYMQAISVSRMDPAAPLTALHLVRADQEALFNQGEIFNPTLIEKIDHYGTLRYLDWNATNGSSVRELTDMPSMEDFSWYYHDGGVPLEVMVQLANRAGTDMWFNIPVQATDNYVRQVTQYIRDNLRPDLKLNLEYSNEVWNWLFDQSRYAARQGSILFGRDANGDGVINPDDPAEANGSGNPLFYGYRSAQIAHIAQGVFADTPDRLKAILATHTVYQGYENLIFDGVSRANLGSVSDLFDGWAITAYFGGHLAGDNPADRETLLRWARSGSAGLDAAFEALVHGTGIQSRDSLDYLRTVINYQGQVAENQGLALMAYEGGFGFWATNFAPEDQADMMALIARMKDDPRMGDAYLRMVGDFAAAGGDNLMAFINAAHDGVHATYGTLDSIYDDSAAYQALKSVQSDTADVVTPLASYVLGSRISNLTYIGSDDFTGTGNALDNVVRGGPGNNTLRGRDGNDTLFGGSGNDTLDGGVGADRMVGGQGNDIYIVDNERDVVVELPGQGIDEVRTTLDSYQIAPSVENLTYAGRGDFEGRGNAGFNVIRGGAGNDRLLGYAGEDVLIGGAGDDTLNGGDGNDRMEGGPGNDNYTVKEAGDEVIELPNEGYDTIRVHLPTYTLPANVEEVIFRGVGNFAGTGNVLANRMQGGSGNDQLYGLAGNDTLVGLEGDDLLDGGPGNDRMEGGKGNDVYIVDSIGDEVVELAGEGTDEVRTTLGAYVLATNLEHLTSIGTGYFTGTGNAAANRITAGNAGSALSGGAGDDTLIGGAGADRLDGGTGADRMVGGRGDDVYVVDSESDVIVELANEGRDQVRTTLLRYTLAAELEDLAYIGTSDFVGTGNAAANGLEGGSGDDRLYGLAGNDLLIGGAGNDTLDGGAGADRMVGGLGDDLYFVDDAGDLVQELPGQGRDEVRTTLAIYTLPSDVEVLVFTGTGNFYGAGNASDNVIRGGTGDNSLIGGAGNDQLFGGAGNDYLDGGSGADTMDGGLGNDRYAVDNPGDVIIDAGGLDTVFSAISYTLGAGLEYLNLTGTAAIDGTGNDLANEINGNDADNVILGLDGDDRLVGNAGNDRLEGGDGRDTLMGGLGNDVLLGGSGDDLLFGNEGDDVLEGGAGADVLIGGAGADVYRFRAGDLGRSGATDTILGFSRAEGDRLDFSFFDANPATSVRDAFRFIGDAAFSGMAGELRGFANGANWTIQGDLDGDRVADFVLNVGTDQALPPQASDFLF